MAPECPPRCTGLCSHAWSWWAWESGRVTRQSAHTAPDDGGPCKPLRRSCAFPPLSPTGIPAPAAAASLRPGGAREAHSGPPSFPPRPGLRLPVPSLLLQGGLRFTRPPLAGCSRLTGQRGLLLLAHRPAGAAAKLASAPCVLAAHRAFPFPPSLALREARLLYPTQQELTSSLLVPPGGCQEQRAGVLAPPPRTPPQRGRRSRAGRRAAAATPLASLVRVTAVLRKSPPLRICCLPLAPKGW